MMRARTIREPGVTLRIRYSPALLVRAPTIAPVPTTVTWTLGIGRLLPASITVPVIVPVAWADASEGRATSSAAARDTRWCLA